MNKQRLQKDQHDAHCQPRRFERGQVVLAENVRGKWLKGTIVDQTGPVSYRVHVGRQIWRRYVDQLLKGTPHPRSEECLPGNDTEPVLFPPSTTLPYEAAGGKASEGNTTAAGTSVSSEMATTQESLVATQGSPTGSNPPTPTTSTTPP